MSLNLQKHDVIFGKYNTIFLQEHITTVTDWFTTVLFTEIIYLQQYKIKIEIYI